MSGHVGPPESLDHEASAGDDGTAWAVSPAALPSLRPMSVTVVSHVRGDATARCPYLRRPQ